MEPALHEQSPLDPESSDQEVEPHAAEAVTLQEGHEETKSNKDHHMHVLEAWRERNKYSKSKSALFKNQPCAPASRAALTRISVVEIILDIAGDVVSLFVLNPVCVRLFVIPDEHSKENNHRNLPHEADGREADPNVGVPLPAEEIPHGAWWLLAVGSLLNQVLAPVWHLDVHLQL